MVPAVLDENPPDLPATEDRTGQVEVRDVGFQGFRVVGRNALLPFEADPAPLEEREVGLVADQRKDRVRAHGFLTARSLDAHRVGKDLHDARPEQRPDGARADAVLEVGLDPVLHAFRQALAPVHERDPRAVAVQVERRLGRRVLPAHDEDVAPVEGVARDVPRQDVRQVRAGDLEAARVAEEAGREDRRRGFESPRPAATRGLEHEAPARARRHAFDRGLRDHPDAEPLRHAAVVRQRLEARGMRVGRREGNAGNVQEVARREPAHLFRKMEDRSRIPPRS